MLRRQVDGRTHVTPAVCVCSVCLECVGVGRIRRANEDGSSGAVGDEGVTVRNQKSPQILGKVRRSVKTPEFVILLRRFVKIDDNSPVQGRQDRQAGIRKGRGHKRIEVGDMRRPGRRAVGCVNVVALPLLDRKHVVAIELSQELYGQRAGTGIGSQRRRHSAICGRKCNGLAVGARVHRNRLAVQRIQNLRHDIPLKLLPYRACDHVVRRHHRQWLTPPSGDIL